MEHSVKTSRRLSFGLGSLLLLVTLCAVCIAWWVDHNRPSSIKYDVTGPLTVKFKFQRNSNSTASRTIAGARGVTFRDGQIAIYTVNGGIVVSTSNLIEFEWTRD